MNAVSQLSLGQPVRVLVSHLHEGLRNAIGEDILKREATIRSCAGDRYLVAWETGEQFYFDREDLKTEAVFTH